MGDSKVKNENMILDFTHVYRDEDIKDIDRFRYIDCSDIQETDMYCSKNAYEKIWGRIEPYGIQGIHYIDSGNYHYITKIITDHITEPFGLVMYDHHTDMQIPMVPEMMSCGDWAGQTLIQNENLRQLVVVGPPESDIEQTLESYKGSKGRQENVESYKCGYNVQEAEYDDSYDISRDISSERLLIFSAEDLHGGLPEDKLKHIRTDLPLYISIDKDVLGTEYTETVVLLSKGEIDSKKVRVEFSLEDMDMSGFQKGATYEQIKAYVLEHTGLKVSSLYISQIKRKCGLDVGQNYNLSKKEDAKVPKCPPEKEAAIRDALKYFQMI